MTRFTLSAPQRPIYEPNRYRPSPARREAIYGRIRPMDPPRKPSLVARLLKAVRR